MVEKKEIYIPCFSDMRTLHIYLPNSYHQSSRRYPVLYMFDGHNLFYDEDATYGKSWGLKDWLDHHDLEIIVIGLECNHEGNKRLEEFSPYDFDDRNVGFIHGRGKELMQWLCYECKPRMDQMYRTLPSAAYTAIAGSSMGGLMALYSILHHHDIFSKAAILSPFLYQMEDALGMEINSCGSLSAKRFFISWGSDEFRSKNQLARATSSLLELGQILREKQAQVYEHLAFKGRHNEESWEKELDIFLPWLFQ